MKYFKINSCTTKSRTKLRSSLNFDNENTTDRQTFETGYLNNHPSNTLQDFNHCHTTIHTVNHLNAARCLLTRTTDIRCSMWWRNFSKKLNQARAGGAECQKTICKRGFSMSTRVCSQGMMKRRSRNLQSLSSRLHLTTKC